MAIINPEKNNGEKSRIKDIRGAFLAAILGFASFISLVEASSPQGGRDEGETPPGICQVYSQDNLSSLISPVEASPPKDSEDEGETPPGIYQVYSQDNLSSLIFPVEASQDEGETPPVICQVYPENGIPAVNIRAGAGTDYQVIGQITQDEPGNVVGKTDESNNPWFTVIPKGAETPDPTDDQYGAVTSNGKYVKSDCPPLEELPVVSIPKSTLSEQPPASSEVTQPQEITQPSAKLIESFVNALNRAGIAISADQIKQGLTYQTIQGKEGKNFTVPVYYLDPTLFSIPGDFAGPIPLISIRQFTKGLNAGIFVGSNYRSEEYRESQITLNHFNLSFVDGNATKFRNIRPNEGTFRLSPLIAEVNQASLTGNPVVIHNIVWGKKLNTDKKIVWDDVMGPEKLIKSALIDHLTNIVGAEGIKGKVFAYTINEPGVDNDRLMQANPDYVRIAAETIRKTDSNAKIVLNIPENFNLNEKYGDRNPGFTSQLAQELYAAGLIDAVGIQAHIFGANPPSDQEIEAAFNRFKMPDGRQIPIWITEFDINMKDTDSSPLNHASILKRVVKKFLELGCRVINNWEIGDRNSWLEEPPYEGRRSPDANPTLYDDNLEPKLGYFAFLQALHTFATQN